MRQLRALAEENDGIATQLGATDEAIDVCERSACLRPLGKSWELGMEAISLKGLIHSEISFESREEGMRVAASGWSMDRWYDHRSGACVGVMEPGPE